VTRSFLNNSIYSNMLPLFVGQTVIFVSKEPKVKEMLQALRHSPQMVLIGESMCHDIHELAFIKGFKKVGIVSKAF